MCVSLHDHEAEYVDDATKREEVEDLLLIAAAEVALIVVPFVAYLLFV